MAKKRGKKYLEDTKKYQKDKFYEPEETFDLAKELSWAKFDETIDIAIKLGIDTRRSEEQVRGAVDLPNGTGRKVKVAVFAQGLDRRLYAEALWHTGFIMGMSVSQPAKSPITLRHTNIYF